jgi:hypothetical protein
MIDGQIWYPHIFFLWPPWAHCITFKCTMKANVVSTMEPLIFVNPFTQLWRTLSILKVLWNTMLKYFKLVEIFIVRVGEHGGWENAFNFIFHEVQLQNGLNEHFPMVVNMYSQTFFTLNFSYDATFEKWQKMKSRRIEVLDLLESV